MEVFGIPVKLTTEFKNVSMYHGEKNGWEVYVLEHTEKGHTVSVQIKHQDDASFECTAPNLKAAIEKMTFFGGMLAILEQEETQ